MKIQKTFQHIGRLLFYCAAVLLPSGLLAGAICTPGIEFNPEFYANIRTE
jgi:hypothetical protein